MHKLSLTLIAFATLLPLSSASSASEVDMLNRCRKYAASHLNVNSNLLDLKYEGQRTDKTYAVNGGVGPSQHITFQCSFKPNGKSIKHFTVNAPEGCPADVAEAERYRYPDCD
jgi:hypothetical protein